MKATLAANVEDEKDKELREFARNDRAKAEFLLMSLPPFYSNLVQNLRSKTSYSYGDIAANQALRTSQAKRGKKGTSRRSNKG